MERKKCFFSWQIPVILGQKCHKASNSSRHSVSGKGDESDDDDSNVSAPTNDIYRKRQQKRIKWK